MGMKERLELSRPYEKRSSSLDAHETGVAMVIILFTMRFLQNIRRHQRV